MPCRPHLVSTVPLRLPLLALLVAGSCGGEDGGPVRPGRDALSFEDTPSVGGDATRPPEPDAEDDGDIEGDAPDGGPLPPSPDAADAEDDGSPPDDGGTDADAGDTWTGPVFRLVEVTPVSGSTLGQDRPTFALTFDAPVDGEALRTLRLQGTCERRPIGLQVGGGSFCRGTEVQQPTPDTLVLTPAWPILPGEEVTLTLTPALTSTTGGRLEATTVLTFQRPGAGAPWRHTEALDGVNGFPTEARWAGQDGVTWWVGWDDEYLHIGVQGPDLRVTNQAMILAAGPTLPTGEHAGGAYTPTERWFEGHETLLPFHATRVFGHKTVNGTGEAWHRAWLGFAWSERRPVEGLWTSRLEDGWAEFRIRREALGETGRQVRLAMWLRDLDSDCGGACVADRGLGWMYGASCPLAEGGPFLQAIERDRLLDLEGPRPPAEAPLGGRFGQDPAQRPLIYQLLVRTFSNLTPAPVPNGTLAQNGTGRWADLNDAAADALADMGFTHVWWTGVPQQATATDWSTVGQPADDPDILKGLAGSPYAVRDWFDTPPDYALDPARRTDELRAALDRFHAAGLRVIMDYVPNHVARSYRSDVRPDLSFGDGDDLGAFFRPDNAFFYLQEGSPPLRLPTVVEGRIESPTCQVLQARSDYRCDGLFDWNGQGETTFGRVTGNDTASWTPSLGTWYETVKVNFGWDYTRRVALHPTASSPSAAIPRTWQIMDEVIAHWQAVGMDGFRIDMAHMVPPEFMSWLISRSRARDPQVYWVAEAYDTDPAKITAGNTLHALLASGCNATYDDDTYDALKDVYDAGRWANDVDGVLLRDGVLLHHSLRYAENHDEVRLASRHDWRVDGANVGRSVGPAVTTLLGVLGRGPLLVYAGQETGEPAAGIEGFGGDDGRTSIFDYWTLPTLQGWVNNHRYDGGALPADIAALRQRYLRVFRLMHHPALRDGQLWLLNSAQAADPAFGREPGATVSGRWAHAALRFTPDQRLLVVSNLHPTQPLQGVQLQVPPTAWARIGRSASPEGALAWTDALDPARTGTLGWDTVDADGIALPTIAPGDVLAWELSGW